MFNLKYIIFFLVLALVACVSAIPTSHAVHHKHSLRQVEDVRKRVVGAVQPSTTAKVRTRAKTCKARSSSAASSSTKVSSSVRPSSSTHASSSVHATTSAAPSAVSKSSSKVSSTHAASTSSSPAASATKSASSGSSSSSSTSSVISALFPVSQSDAWSTSPDYSGALPLSDSTFRPQKEITDLTHTYMAAPDGKYSMQAIYPAGSYNFQHEPRGGFSFYAPGPAQYDLTTAKEATFAYSVYFPEGFDFNKGGKLPGLYGGDNASVAETCSGGNKVSDCWSVRLMWRTAGAGEIYAYLPPTYSANDVMCNVPPMSVCNPDYGSSVGRGSFTWKTGGWTTVSQRVRLNDAGQANGEMQLFVNGESVINVSGLVLRDQSEGRIYGMQVQTFFGGSDSSWASPTDQQSYFSDFSIDITETL